MRSVNGLLVFEGELQIRLLDKVESNDQYVKPR